MGSLNSFEIVPYLLDGRFVIPGYRHSNCNVMMNNYVVCVVLLVFIDIFDKFSHVAGSQVLHIRGIPASKSSLYAPDRDFTCLDGSLLIPFRYVNDEYCDCADGTDEPGTAACRNGAFYCQNTDHKGFYIPSSWVNDGVCDCCDASDEYVSGKQCPNNCHELAREARLEAQKAAELIKEGNKVRLDMVVRGKQLKSEHQTRLVKLRVDFEEAQLLKKEKEILKTQAEERESIALEKYKPVEPEQPASEAKEEEEPQEVEAQGYFKLLDSDSSGTVTIIELQTRVTFDKDRNGAVSEEEALFFLNNQKELTLQEFVDSAWPIIKPFLMLEQGMFKPATAKPDGEVQDEGSDEQEKDEEDVPEDEEVAPEDHEPEHEESQIQYDDETQALIDEASGARERFQEAEKSVSELQSEIRSIEDKLDRDYGHDEEFSSLDGECFDYTDLEYVYSVCMFNRATQKSKSGGSDVNLGHWHEWVGPEGNKYSKMKYDRGLTCWNGPSRSTIVNLSCGKENKLISVTEPSRCEYAMEFLTPALCNPSIDSGDSHDEL